jgi:glycosyltransferase involved in cell wall biosynthesis
LKTSPLFSVLIANYNNGRYLRECLQSIFKQSYTHWEIVLVDDASNDESQDIYLEYADHPQVRIFHNTSNQGVANTKKECIDRAGGHLLGFVDPDDTLHPKALAIMVACHAAHPDHSLIYSTHYICDPNLKVLQKADGVWQVPFGQFSWAYSGKTISHFATFKKAKYNKTEGISTWFLKAVDKDLYYKLEETGTVLFVDEPLYYYRHHEGSISLHQHIKTATLFDWAARAMVFVRKNVTPEQLESMHHKKLELAAGLVLTGLYLISKGKRKDGLKVVQCALSAFKLQAITGFGALAFRIIRNNLSKMKVPN